METSVYAPGTGGGTQNVTRRPKQTMRGTEDKQLNRPADLSPIEIEILKNLPVGSTERKSWLEKRRKTKKKNINTCEKCGRNPPRDANTPKCASCLSKINTSSNEKNKNNREQGLCWCLEPLATKEDGTKSAYCEFHRDERLKRNIERIKNGKCIDCNEDAAIGKNGKKLIRCQNCLDRDKRINHH